MFAFSPPGLLALLLMGHFLGDFVLQHDRMAVEKCPGCDSTLSWRWWLTGHAASHGLIVALLTGVAGLGVAEWIAHWLIDWLKCRLRMSLALDQALHILCKLVWVGWLVARA